MTALAIRPTEPTGLPDPVPEADASTATFVLLGGVPGAGKTTLIDRLGAERPDVRTVDPERLRDTFARLLPAWVRYRWYRPLVHTLNAVRTLVLILRGPARSGWSMVVHDPATRPRRRRLVGRLARWRGWVPVLVVIDVSRAEALDGQQRRGRVVASASFGNHWRRWQQQRATLTAVSRQHAGAGPWSRVLVVDRDTAPSALAEVLG
jgi:hypothetical protein